MALTPQTYSLSGLEAELGIDRRTLGKRLAHVPPAERRGNAKRWRLRDVLAALERDPVGGREGTGAGGPVARPAGEAAEALALPEAQLVPWLCETVPLRDYAASVGVEHEELVALIAYGMPILPPHEGEDVARVSPAHADRWRFLASVFVETAGGDGVALDHLAHELRRIRGLDG